MLSTSLHSREKNTQSWLFDLLFLGLFLGFFYAIWLGSHALFTPDEGRYSEVAREMLVTGDYITPRLNGVPFLDKPALYYWLQASAIHFFGLKEWALRFWPALMGVLGSLVVYGAGRILFNRRTGIFSAIILATCPLYYGAAHYANLDLEVAVLIGNSLLFFLLALESSGKKSRDYFLFFAYFFAGLAALTKGLIGIVFPAMIIGLWIIILNRWSILKNMRLLSGFILFCLITVPWYVMVQKANPQFFHFFFVTQQFSRYLTTQAFNNRVAIWFYFPVVLAGIFPWTIFFIQGFWQFFKKIWQARKLYRVELFLLLWTVLVFAFFSIPRSKTVGYILPIFPPIALMIGNYLSEVWDSVKNKSVLAGLYSYVVLSVFIFVICQCVPAIESLHVIGDFAVYVRAVGFMVLISGLFVFTWRYQKISYALSCLLAIAGLFLLILSASTAVNNVRSVKPLVVELKSVLQPQDEIVAFYRYYQDLPIYLQKRIVIVADWKAKDIAQNDNWVRELWYGMSYQDTSQWLIDEDTFWQRWESKKHLYVFTEAHYLNKLYAKAPKNIYKIAQLNNTVLLSNHPPR